MSPGWSSTGKPDPRRQPSVAELETLLDEWLDEVVFQLWHGNHREARMMWWAAFSLAVKLDVDTVAIGAQTGHWRFETLQEWVIEAHASRLGGMERSKR